MIRLLFGCQVIVALGWFVAFHALGRDEDELDSNMIALGLVIQAMALLITGGALILWLFGATPAVARTGHGCVPGCPPMGLGARYSHVDLRL